MKLIFFFLELCSFAIIFCFNSDKYFVIVLLKFKEIIIKEILIFNIFVCKRNPKSI